MSNLLNPRRDYANSFVELCRQGNAGMVLRSTLNLRHFHFLQQLIYEQSFANLHAKYHTKLNDTQR